MTTVLSPEAAEVFILTIKARTKSLPEQTRYLALGNGYRLSCTYAPPKREQDAVIPELFWRWDLSSKAGDQTLTEAQAMKALQGEMPEQPMSGEAVFALLARNSENIRG